MTDAHPTVRVALNAVAANPGGGLSYLLNQAPYLAKSVDLTVYARRPVAEALKRFYSDIKVEALPRWALRLPLRLLWEHLIFPARARNADVLYTIGSFASLGARQPQVVVVLIPYVFGPEWKDVLAATEPPKGFHSRLVLQRLLGRVASRRATVMVATSQFTARQIRGSCRGADVRVVPLAGAAIPSNEPARRVPGMTFPRPYALSVGGDRPHKDHLPLIRSWPRDLGIDLVLVGSGSAEVPERLAPAMRERDDIHWLGPVPEYRMLFELYRGAKVFVAHSLIEGFGMTPLEAMAEDAPVIATDIPAHREVCDGAALFYDPFDPTSLRAALERLAAEDGLAESLVEAGRERVRRYSWEENASAMTQVLAEVGRAARSAR